MSSDSGTASSEEPITPRETPSSSLEPREVVEAREEAALESLPDELRSNLSAIREILSKPQPAEQCGEAPHERPAEADAAGHGTVPFLQADGGPLATFIELYERYSDPKDLADLLAETIPTPFGDIRHKGMWEGNAIISLDAVTEMLKNWKSTVSVKVPEADRSAFEAAIIDALPDEMKPKAGKRVDVSLVLMSSNVTARIQRTITLELTDRERSRRKMRESQYKRSLGKSLNTRMRGVGVQERYLNAEIKSSLAVGTGHMTGMVTAGLLGYYLAWYIFQKNEIQCYIGGLIGVMVFIVCEAILFITRESKITRTLKEAERVAEALRVSAVRPSRDGGIAPISAAEVEKYNVAERAKCESLASHLMKGGALEGSCPGESGRKEEEETKKDR